MRHQVNGIRHDLFEAGLGIEFAPQGKLFIDRESAYAGVSGRVLKGSLTFIHNFGMNNTFLGLSAGNLQMLGQRNTAVGEVVLYNNQSGSYNTGVGQAALLGNTIGNYNAAVGQAALFNNAAGNRNVATGYDALFSNTTGGSGVSGGGNTAVGTGTLSGNTTGNSNTALGDSALSSNTTGSGNVAIGANAGINLTTGDGNITIGHAGVAGEAATIRVGNTFHQRFFAAGVRGVTTGSPDAIAVLIDSSGQLGTVSSSARAKEQIRDMGEVSSALLKLRPVTFHYKGQSQGSNPLHFGLIAEEVEEVLPELVVHRSTGEAETVLYHEMPAMLLNELQKQHRTIEEQRGRIGEQREQIKVLAARLLRLEELIGSRAE